MYPCPHSSLKPGRPHSFGLGLPNSGRPWLAIIIIIISSLLYKQKHEDNAGENLAPAVSLLRGKSLSCPNYYYEYLRLQQGQLIRYPAALTATSSWCTRPLRNMTARAGGPLCETRSLRTRYTVAPIHLLVLTQLLPMERAFLFLFLLLLRTSSKPIGVS